MENLKKRLGEKKLTVGSWIQIPDTFTAEIMAKSGFDWLAIDMEHGLIDMKDVFRLIQVIDLAGSVPLVRLNVNDASTIRRVMDAGAAGVIVPMVNSADDAQKAVEAVKYPPQGKRSFGLGRAHGYGRKFKEYISASNSRSILVVQIEHIDAVRNLDEILEIKGIDAVIIGPYDLSGSMGIPGKFNDTKFIKVIGEISKKVKSKKIALGFHLVQPGAGELNKKIKEGFTFIAYGMDTIYLSNALSNAVNDIRKG
ncbi:MAG: aldolase/citrate lyase family protein [Candidatus Saganbacteria bacterium]|nr:aldolase/citrate lyase family protein [Candidatus Saganbacteria bacterium]